MWRKSQQFSNDNRFQIQSLSHQLLGVFQRKWENGSATEKDGVSSGKICRTVPQMRLQRFDNK
jgi:hypothetical protein